MILRSGTEIDRNFNNNNRKIRRGGNPPRHRCLREPGDMIQPTRTLHTVSESSPHASHALWQTLRDPGGLCRRQRAGSAPAASPAQRRRRLAPADEEADDAALLRRFGALLQAATGRQKRKRPGRRRWVGALLQHRRLALAPLHTPLAPKSGSALRDRAAGAALVQDDGQVSASVSGAPGPRPSRQDVVLRVGCGASSRVHTAKVQVPS